MKKYRCPCCGKETFTTSQRFLAQVGRIYLAWRGTGVSDLRGIPCPNCGKVSRVYVKSGIDVIVFIIAIIIGVILINLGAHSKNATYFLVAALLILLAWFIIRPLVTIKAPFVAYDRKTGKFIFPDQNACVKTDSSQKIKAYGTYGIKISKKTLSAKFNDTFRDGIVPVTFIGPLNKNDQRWSIHIIDQPAVPADMMEEGTDFKIVHQDSIVGFGTFCSPKN